MEYPHEKEILEFLKDKNLIVVSNRGPIEFKHNRDHIIMKRGAGGLVSTLMPLMEALNGVWIASAMTLGDVVEAARFPRNKVPIPLQEPKFWVQFVLEEKERYEEYYSVISNPLLWFLQHYMWNSPYTPDIDDNIHKAWNNGYIHMNKKFADHVVEESKRHDKDPLIMLQDYHLYLCPAFIRSKMKKTFLSHFIHIPWPQSDYFKILPQYMRESILNGLLSNNLLGFHIPRYVNNFLGTCEEFADEIDYENQIVHYKGNETHVKSYPISVDSDGIKKLAVSKEVIEKEKIIKKIKEDKFLFYRTDRADLSKNIIRGFKAYDIFLEKHPEYIGKVVFLTTGKPTRQQIKEYENYLEDIQDIIKQINHKYAKNNWNPIECLFKADYNLVVAAFKNYDCIIVNPISDGMNIVPKEAAVVNEQNGVLILSETAGCFDEIKDETIPVNPYDISETAGALYRAVTMNENERKKRLINLNTIVASRNIYDWISDQFRDIKSMQEEMSVRVANRK
jgi:trehalose 6-phosphate synthase